MFKTAGWILPAILAACVSARADDPKPPATAAAPAAPTNPPAAPATPPSPAEVEKQELSKALADSNTSPFDMIRALEAHLKKYPNSDLRTDVVRLLAKEAVDARDTARIVKYGPPTLVATPNDALLLDRTAAALLNVGGKENAAKALEYGQRFVEFVKEIPVVEGRDPARHQEEHDRGMARGAMYQARALMILERGKEAEEQARIAFNAYADEESARVWARALEQLGDNDQAAQHLADAFAIPDIRVTEENRSRDRRELGELYRKLHGGSEAGLGDQILAAYDRTSAVIELRKKRMQTLDPNTGLSDPMKFTLTGLDGGSLPLASLRGKVLILDFWATWCTPCRAQHPLYDQVKERFKDRSDVLFLSVDSDDDQSVVSPFLEANHWSRAVYMDSGLVRLLEVNSIPATLLFDKQGRLASRMDGFVPDRFVDMLSERINAALDAPGSDASAH